MPMNLIQNYITNKTSYVPPSKKEAPEFDIHHELNNKTFIKPLPGRGKFSKMPIIHAPSAIVKNVAYDVNALQHGWHGEANDHQLGKLNDVGMKIGGLAIAGYLFTKRQTPLTKAMEFVGLGSFFASMAIWPKIGIQLPARLIHGVDVHKEYEDSFGRKKPFYQDPQFLPWDLYKDKEIHKIGDRLGVPKDIPNRREFIQEKMKKIAIQNNTLWMLTAGFATPIMSALICNQLEGPLSKIQHNIKNNKMNNLLANFPEAVKNEHNHDTMKEVTRILDVNKNLPMTDELIHDLSKAMTRNFDLNTTAAFESDLKKMLSRDSFMINKEVVDEMVKQTNKSLKNVLDKEVLEKILPTESQLTKYLDDEGFFGNDYSRVKIDNIFDTINEKLSDEIDLYNQKNPQNPITKKQIKKINDIFVKAETKNNPLMKSLLKEPYAKVNERAQTTLRNLAKKMDDFKANVATLDNYAITKVGAAPETVIANIWNDTSEKFMKILGITHKEIADTRGDRELIGPLIRKKLDTIASSNVSYKKAINALVTQVAELEKAVKRSDISDKMFGKTNDSAYDKLCNSVFDAFGKEFGEMKMEDFTNRILGKPIRSNEAVRVPNGSLKNLQKKIATDRLLGVKSSFYRLINTLDLHRRIASGENRYFPALHAKMPREVKEEVVELSKTISIKGHTSDYITKFHMLRNPNYDRYDLSDIEIKNGKTVYKYFKPGVTENKVDIPQDVHFFKENMKLMFENPMHIETEKAFTQYGTMLDEMHAYRKASLYNLGNSKYFAKVYHMAVNGIGEVVTTDSKKFNLTGIAIDELLSKTGQQMYNTRKWLKIFGTMGAALLGVTVGAQFFFGKMKPPKERIKETKKDNLV